MKKILVAGDALHFPIGIFSFIREMQLHEKVFVKGLFFTDVDYGHIMPVGYSSGAGPFTRLKRSVRLNLDQCEDHFRFYCESQGISHSLVRKSEFWNDAVFTKESRFSDLVLISEELFGSNVLLKDQPNFYMQDVLRKAECPVVIVPEAFRSIDRLKFAYDGSADSVFAIKQFAQSLPYFKDLPAEFVFANGEEKEIPNRALLEEFVSSHFSAHEILQLNFEPSKYLSAWLADQEGSLLVAGSYHRNSLSNILHKSFIQPVIADHVCPIFIAHNT